MTDDAVQNHRLDTIERRLDKRDEMLAKLIEAQVRTDEQFTVLAETQQSTQALINDIAKKILTWMMGVGSALIAAILGGQVML